MYRTWRTLLTEPKLVPVQLWTQCVAPAPEDWEKARSTYGPHTQKLIQVYANPAARRTLKNAKSKAFPAGSILVKEKMVRDNAGQSQFDGVGVMAKRSGDQFQESGGWEFRYFPSNDSDRAQIQTACAACHKTAERDSVFGDYPQK